MYAKLLALLEHSVKLIVIAQSNLTALSNKVQRCVHPYKLQDRHVHKCRQSHSQHLNVDMVDIALTQSAFFFILFQQVPLQEFLRQGLEILHLIFVNQGLQTILDNLLIFVFFHRKIKTKVCSQLDK